MNKNYRGHRLLGLVMAVVAGAVPALAESITIHDAYGAPAATLCSGPNPRAFTNCDVVGARRNFDIQSITVNRGTDSISFQLNFNFGSSNLSPFQIGSGTNSLWIGVGDLLIQDMATRIIYGIPLVNRLGYQAGGLYSVDQSGLLTSDEALLMDYQAHNPGAAALPAGWYWRSGWIVRMGGSDQLLGQGSVAGGTSVLTLNTDNYNSSQPTEFQTVITFTGAEADLLLQLTGGSWGAQFASGTCANDVLDFHMPEPSTYALLGAGLVLVGVLGRKKS